MRIIPLTEQYGEGWDKVVYDSADAWLFHLYDWGLKVSQEIWAYRNLSFLIEDNGQIVAVFPLFLREGKLLPFVKLRALCSGHGIGGLAVIEGLGEKHKKRIERFAFDYVDSLAKQCKADKLELSLPPLAPANLPPLAKRVNPLLLQGLKDNSSATYLVDLQNNSCEDLWKRMEVRSRTAIRKAEQSKVIIKQAENVSDVERYYELHRQTYNRTGAKPHPFAYFETIYVNKWAHMFLAECNNQTIAAINVAAFKTGVVYLTGAADYQFHSLGANNLLQWHAMKWAKQQGYKWYDSGEAQLGTSDPKLAGLAQFKASFGGELYPYYKGVRVYSHHKLRIIEFLAAVRKDFFD